MLVRDAWLQARGNGSQPFHASHGSHTRFEACTHTHTERRCSVQKSRHDATLRPLLPVSCNCLEYPIRVKCLCVYIYTQIQTDRQTDRRTDRQTHGQTNRQTHRQAHRHMHRHTDAQTHRHTNTQKNRQPQTDSQTDPRMCAYVYTYTFTRGMSLLIAICKLSNSGMCPYQP